MISFVTSDYSRMSIVVLHIISSFMMTFASPLFPITTPPPKTTCYYYYKNNDFISNSKWSVTSISEAKQTTLWGIRTGNHENPLP